MLHGPVVVPYGERVAAEHCRVHEVVVVDRIFEGAAAVGGLVECREGVAGLDAPQVYYAVAHLGERVCVLPAHAEPPHKYGECISEPDRRRVSLVSVLMESYCRNLLDFDSLFLLFSLVRVPAGNHNRDCRQKWKQHNGIYSESCHLEDFIPTLQI